MEYDSIQTPPDPPLFVLEYRKPDLVPERPLIPIIPRIFHFVTAVILPVVCFAASVANYPLGPDYQRDHWNDYLGLIPNGKVGWPFHPLLNFSIYSAAMMIIWNARWYQGRGRIYFWIGLVVLVAASVAIFPRADAGILELAIVGPLVVAPALTLTTFVLLSILVLRRGNRLDSPKWVVLPWTVGWFTAFIAQGMPMTSVPAKNI